MDYSPVFNDTNHDKNLQSYFVKIVYHSRFGEGQVLIWPRWITKHSGLDPRRRYFTHGPTKNELIMASNFIMNTALHIGLVMQALNPPAQVVNFSWFNYDTRTIPTLHIPANKVNRTIAMIKYLTYRCDYLFLRLVMIMVTDFLQFLVLVTPGNIGESFLYPVYQGLHHLKKQDISGTR